MIFFSLYFKDREKVDRDRFTYHSSGIAGAESEQVRSPEFNLSFTFVNSVEWQKPKTGHYLLLLKVCIKKKVELEAEQAHTQRLLLRNVGY